MDYVKYFNTFVYAKLLYKVFNETFINYEKVFWHKFAENRMILCLISGEIRVFFVKKSWIRIGKRYYVTLFHYIIPYSNA